MPTYSRMNKDVQDEIANLEVKYFELVWYARKRPEDLKIEDSVFNTIEPKMLELHSHQAPPQNGRGIRAWKCALVEL